MKNILKFTFAVVVLVTSAAIGYYSYTRHQQEQFAWANPLLEENLEALTENKGALTLKFCKSPGGGKKGTVMYICASGTTLFYNTAPPSPTMYACSNRGIPKIDFSLKANNGYCYLK